MYSQVQICWCLWTRKMFLRYGNVWILGNVGNLMWNPSDQWDFIEEYLRAVASCRWQVATPILPAGRNELLCHMVNGSGRCRYSRLLHSTEDIQFLYPGMDSFIRMHATIPGDCADFMRQLLDSCIHSAFDPFVFFFFPPCSCASRMGLLNDFCHGNINFHCHLSS